MQYRSDTAVSVPRFRSQGYPFVSCADISPNRGISLLAGPRKKLCLMILPHFVPGYHRVFIRDRFRIETSLSVKVRFAFYLDR